MISIPVGMLLAEIACHIFSGVWFHRRLNQMRNQISTFIETHDDDRRQDLILNTGLVTLQLSLLTLAVLMLLLSITYLPVRLFEWDYSSKFFYLISLSIVATAWMILRWDSSYHKNYEARSNYSLLSRWLHWMALEPNIVRHISFDLERLFFLRKKLSAESNSNQSIVPGDAPVYVCGLARSGTTILLHILDEIEVFRSLTYRDMPFVLAPNLWNRVTKYSRNSVITLERAHGDNVMVNFDSSEGFEEVFWRTFSKIQLDNQSFSVEESDMDVLENFADYRALVANSRPTLSDKVPKRYLSKNNNNLLRLSVLCGEPTATILLVYRAPIQAARSLYRQHQRFSAMQATDGFILTYMGWLLHHEFGLGHLPFNFAVSRMDLSLSPDDQNYWLDYWNAVYSYVLSLENLRLYLVNYDDLCIMPSQMLEAIFEVLDVEADVIALAELIVTPKPILEGSGGFCPELLRRAELTHHMLLDSPKNIQGTTNIGNRNSEN
jgi:hypothetical protein